MHDSCHPHQLSVHTNQRHCSHPHLASSGVYMCRTRVGTEPATRWRLGPQLMVHVREGTAGPSYPLRLVHSPLTWAWLVCMGMGYVHGRGDDVCAYNLSRRGPIYFDHPVTERLGALIRPITILQHSYMLSLQLQQLSDMHYWVLVSPADLGAQKVGGCHCYTRERMLCLKGLTCLSTCDRGRNGSLCASTWPLCSYHTFVLQAQALGLL
jgi:hypothetical protein